MTETSARGRIEKSDSVPLLVSWLFTLILAFSVGPHGSDLIAEQMAGRALLDGISPYATLADLSEIYDGAVDWEWVIPRTPAGLMIVVPLAVVPLAPLLAGMTVVNVTAMLIVVVLCARMAGRSLRATALVFPILMTSEPGGQVIQHANLSALIGLAVVMTWWFVKRGDSWIAGLPLGVAAAARIFPLLLAIVLLVGGRRKAGLAALVTTVGLNLVALLIPGISIIGSVNALAGAEQFLGHSNSFSIPGVLVRSGVPFSIGVMLSFAVPAVLAIWILVSRPPWERGMLFGAPLMLIVNSTSWPHYMSNAGPSVASVDRRLIGIVIALWYAPLIGVSVSWAILTSLLVVLVGLRMKFRQTPIIAG